MIEITSLSTDPENWHQQNWERHWFEATVSLFFYFNLKDSFWFDNFLALRINLKNDAKNTILSIVEVFRSYRPWYSPTYVSIGDLQLCRWINFLHTDDVIRIRSKIEEWISLIAVGKADFETVVEHSLNSFSEKFAYFVSKVRILMKFPWIFISFFSFSEERLMG